MRLDTGKCSYIMQAIAASHTWCEEQHQPTSAALPELQRPRNTAQGDRSTLTPVPLHNVAGQTSTPRSRDDIRQLFTKRPALLRSANPQSSMAQPTSVQQPPSRLQHQIGSGPAQYQPNVSSRSLPGPHVHTEGQHAAAMHQHLLPGPVQIQPPIGPNAEFQAPPSFRQYACSGSSLSAPTSSHRNSGHSSHEQQCTAPQRNSVPAQYTSGAVTSTEGRPISRPSITSGAAPGVGPMMRAEILMGPAATIEVNVRYHDHVATALNK